MAAMWPTPPRPVPGIWPETPVASAIPPPPLFSSSMTPSSRSPYTPTTPSSNTLTAANPSGLPVQVQPSTTMSSRPAEVLEPTERAARTINEALAGEIRFPDLDSYLSPGHSSEYDLRSSAAWAPFQKVRMYNIPDAIFEQYNRAQVSTSMGLFAELHHAWVTIDNALYMWDYTINNAELFGFEEQSHSITAVKLGTPRAGVFLPSVKHIIILATTSDVMLLGLGSNENQGGLSLFQTGMSVSVKGLDISSIASSTKSGRIFFGGRTENEVYEITYQQEDRWFSSKSAKVCHTSSTLSSLAAPFTFGQRTLESVEQIVVDDSRDLVYTLSSLSAVRVFHMKADGSLTLSITKPAAEIFSNISHVINQNESINPRTRIVAISTISAQEALRYHLVATTATGYRIYLSATQSSYWGPSRSGAPMNMQAQHIKTPPIIAPNPAGQAQQPGQHIIEHIPGINQPIRSLTQTRLAARYAPGFFFCFTTKDANSPTDTLFVSAPDAAKLAKPPESGQASRSSEAGVWLSLNSRAEDIGISTPYYPPTSAPTGFGNDLAVQFDKPVPEVAVLTNTGIHVLRRRRLVDTFAALIQQGGGSEGFQGEVNSFIRLYGRTETLATALAVACGQGVELSQDARSARINDPQVLDIARKTFIEYGGKPSYNENTIADKSVPAIDTVRPSPRHAAIAVYLGRLLRSTWKTLIAREDKTSTGEKDFLPGVALEKLKSIQEDLTSLQRFFKTNKSFIKGLSGPDDLSMSSSKNDEVAMQGEHRALHSLVKFVSNAIECISFILVLFDERVADIVLLLPEQTRPKFLQLSFEGIFSTKEGHSIAKELVKAIVNRNIMKGSNVETVAEALRRRCGSFCSAEDVVIFKAQEQLKRASEAGANAEFARNLLNESLNLFERVADNLPKDYLDSAVQQFTALQFYGGAIQLVLKVAHESDKGNEALSWLADGRPQNDLRKAKFDQRTQCYDLIHNVINAADESIPNGPTFIDGRPTASATRRNEAYDVMTSSKDEVFLTNLYDWYLAQGWHDRLLAIDSPFIVTYLQRRSEEDISHADLLWKYHGQTSQFYDAARVQLQLARSNFNLNLDQRIEYLSRARANASTFTPMTGGANRKSKQRLLTDINEFLDVGSLQSEVLQRLKADPRLSDPAHRQAILDRVNGPILPITELFNEFADNAGYYDVCLLIYQVADYRDSGVIKQTWQQLIGAVHEETVEKGEAQPYEAVAEKIRSLGGRLRGSEFTFPVQILLPVMERYSFEYQRNVGPPNWVVDVFLDLQVAYERLFDVLENMFFTNETPFSGTNRRIVASEIVYVVGRWLHDTLRGSSIIFDSEKGAIRVDQCMQMIIQTGATAGVDEETTRMARLVRERIARVLE